MTERFRDITAIWNWLPAFRAVADTEHLPTAGKMMSVTGPALSRSVKNLETNLGKELFSRTGRSIKLNSDGQHLVEAVRIAMRTIHSAVEALIDESLRGDFRWTSTWNASGRALDATAALIDTHPQISPLMLPFAPLDYVGQLHRGELDFALVNTPVNIEGIASTLIAEEGHSVFCSPNHILATAQNLSLSDLGTYAFGAPLADENGFFADGWPAEYNRRVTMQFTQMESGYQACLAGHVLAVLPNNAAEGLIALTEMDSRRQIYGIHRKTILPGPSELLVELLLEASLLDR